MTSTLIFVFILSYSEVIVATRSSPYPDQMVDQHLEMTTTALNVSGDQDT